MRKGIGTAGTGATARVASWGNASVLSGTPSPSVSGTIEPAFGPHSLKNALIEVGVQLEPRAPSA